MKLACACLVCLMVLGLAPVAGAQSYHSFTADAGVPLPMRFVHRHQGGEHLGVTVSDDKRQFGFYQTGDYGDHWTHLADFTVPANLSGVMASGSWCWPELWVFWASYLDPATYELGGQAWYSTDHGASFQDLNALVAARFGSSRVQVQHAQPVEGGVVLIFSEAAMPGQGAVRSDSTRLWRLPLAEGGSPTQGYWELPLYNSQFAAASDGTIVGFGTDAGDQVQIFRVPADSNQLSQRPVIDLHPQMHPRVVHRVGREGSFTLADINTEVTAATVAAWSRDGIDWTIFEDNTGPANPEEPGFHLFDALALDQQRGYVSLAQWSGGTEGLGSVVAYKIKQTSDGGGSWQTILEGNADNHVYGISATWDEEFCAFPQDLAANYRQAGQYVWPR